MPGHRSTAARAGGLLAALALIGCGEVEREVAEEQIRATVSRGMQEKGGRLVLADPRTGERATLLFERVRERVVETEGGRYIVAADFRTETDTVYRVDFYLAPAGEEFAVRDTVVREIAGERVISDAERAALDTMTGGP